MDRIGYDDDALTRRLGRAGAGAKLTKFTDYIKTKNFSPAFGANIAVIEAAGEIVDGTAQDDLLQQPSPASPATIFPRPSARRRATRTSRPSCSGWICPAAR